MDTVRLGGKGEGVKKEVERLGGWRLTLTGDGDPKWIVVRAETETTLAACVMMQDDVAYIPIRLVLTLLSSQLYISATQFQHSIPFAKISCYHAP